MTTTYEAHVPSHSERLGATPLPRIIVWVGAALREAREAATLLELIADSRIATPATLSRRAAAIDSFA
jgi:hypothetical protein